MPETGYIAYIDESGDDGIKFVSPANPKSASEWFIISGIVVRAEKNSQVQPWTQEMIAALNQRQRKQIHFSELNDDKRLLMAKKLSGLPMRGFVVISNKKNMSGYQNPRAATIKSKNPFYCWMSRLLLESITDFCERDSLSIHKEIRTLKVIFSRRGGVECSYIQDYMRRMETQSKAGGLYIDTRVIKWNVLDIDKIEVLDQSNRPGLQLADILSGSFYQAVGDERRPIIPNPEYAKVLRPVMAKDAANKRFWYSVKLMPNINKLVLTEKQKQIFDFYRQI